MRQFHSKLDSNVRFLHTTTHRKYKGKNENENEILFCFGWRANSYLNYKWIQIWSLEKSELTISRETQTFEGRPRNLWLCLLRGLGLNGFREQAFLIDVLSSLWLKLSIRTASHFFSLSFNLLQHSFSRAISSSPWERERERRRRRRVGVEVEGAGCTI